MFRVAWTTDKGKFSFALRFSVHFQGRLAALQAPADLPLPRRRGQGESRLQSPIQLCNWSLQRWLEVSTAAMTRRKVLTLSVCLSSLRAWVFQVPSLSDTLHCQVPRL